MTTEALKILADEHAHTSLTLGQPTLPHHVMVDSAGWRCQAGARHRPEQPPSARCAKPRAGGAKPANPSKAGTPMSLTWFLLLLGLTMALTALVLERRT